MGMIPVTADAQAVQRGNSHGAGKVAVAAPTEGSVTRDKPDFLRASLPNQISKSLFLLMV